MQTSTMERGPPASTAVAGRKPKICAKTEMANIGAQRHTPGPTQG